MVVQTVLALFYRYMPVEVEGGLEDDTTHDSSERNQEFRSWEMT